MARFMVVAVRDLAVGAFMAPFVVRTGAEAIRAFSDAVNDPKAEFHKHPEDYQLFTVGEWDDWEGRVIELQNSQLLISAKDCLATQVDVLKPARHEWKNFADLSQATAATVEELRSELRGNGKT